ncbi:MAG TPA: cupin, partial [candidate division Zixibacteria bacterium]|nr:cupin [candidate division Zixibacteria bacterium]
MISKQVVPETKGVTVKIITTIDLGPEIEGMQGR